MRAQYAINYYPAVTAEVFAVMDGRQELVHSFRELQMAMEYCREGFASRGERVHWHVKRDGRATIFRTQEIYIPDLSRSVSSEWEAVSAPRTTVTRDEQGRPTEKDSPSRRSVRSEPPLEVGPSR
jgi:YD repeat-containing protein